MFDFVFFRYGIHVAGISTDGDPRGLSCMQHSLKCIDNQNSSDVLSDLNNENNFSVIQDPTHIFTKLRNRLLLSTINMQMGNKEISVCHLEKLINSVSKNEHGIVRSDILPEDKQNFCSFQKVTEDRVLNSLEHNVINSEATILYLKLSKDIVSAFMEFDMKPLDRVYKIWHSLYIIRAWRTWIKKSSKFTLAKNFISSNAFKCVEINAYCLLNLIKIFRNQNAPDLFLIPLFQSQICESTFRQMRSMTSINWTKINFSLLELIHIIHRIELQYYISYVKLKNDVVFPRITNRYDKCVIHALPNDNEIRDILEKARNDALDDVSKFGIYLNADDIVHCDLQKKPLRSKKKPQTQLQTSNESRDESSSNIQSYFACSSLRDYSQTNTNIEASKKYIEITDDNGNKKTVLIGSLVWLLTEDKESLSNDRLRRVQNLGSTISKKRKNKSSDLTKEKRKKK